MSDIMTRSPAPGWTMYRLGQLFEERREKVSDKDFPPLSVTMNGIVPQLDSAAKTDDGDNRKLVRVGDYVINSRSDRKGSGGISRYDGSVSLISIVLEPTRIDPAFAHHMLRSTAFQEEFYRWGHGIVADLWTTRYSDMKNIRLYLPDLTTQRQIADFLDRETARIDLLIEKKQRMITALGDSRNAVLLKAVTCGLDGQAAMKATETSWVPQIPAHWTIQRMKFLGQAIIGLTYAPEDLVEEGDGTPVLRANNIQSGKLVRDDIVYVTTPIPKKLWLRHGDILICSRNGSRNLIGKNGVVSGEFVAMTFGAFNTVFRSKHHRFLYWVLQSPVFAYQAGAFLTSTINQLTVSTLSNLSVPFPPAVEQNSISDYLDAQEIEFDRLVKTIKTSIARLREYRSALITAAVTGQIDPATHARSGQTERHLEDLMQRDTA